MNILGITKTVSDVVVSAGVGAIVGNAIKASTPIDTKIVSKISIGVGSLVLSSMVGTQAANYTAEQIDSTVVQLKALKTLFKKKN